MKDVRSFSSKLKSLPGFRLSMGALSFARFIGCPPSDFPLRPALIGTAVEAQPKRVHFGSVEKIHPAILGTDQNGFRPVCEVAHEKEMGGKAPALWKLKSCLQDRFLHDCALSQIVVPAGLFPASSYLNSKTFPLTPSSKAGQSHLASEEVSGWPFPRAIRTSPSLLLLPLGSPESSPLSPLRGVKPAHSPPGPLKPGGEKAVAPTR
jgi:hypothetical protein